MDREFALKLDPDVDVESLIAPDGPRPFGLLELGDETWDYDEKGRGVAGILTMPFTVHFVGEISPAVADESRLREHFKGCADIEQALGTDATMNSLGALGAWVQIARRRLSGTGSLVWSSVDGSVKRRYVFGQPKWKPLMRIATCTGDITLTLLGNRESVRIGKGTRVDLDRVIGDADGARETIADQLGQHLEHFAVGGDVHVAAARDAEEE